MKQRYGIYVGALIAAVLTGCGGGGGGSSAPAQTPVAVTPPAPVVTPPVVTAPILVKNTSYANAKEQGFAAITLPSEMQFSDAYVQADFKQDGKVMLFATRLKYDVKNPATATTASEFAFYSKNANGTWSKETSMIDTPNGCVHPRKAIVADFNKDGKPDVLVACHGFDAAPFAGEENFLVLSNGNGTFTSKAIQTGKPGFFHSAAAADFNGDGNIDFVATDNNATTKARMFLGNGNGTFTENTVLPAAVGKNEFFTVEATDVDSDGKIDLIFGADENMGTSRSLVVVGDGTGNYTASRTVELPTDTANGLALDFVVKNGAIYVLRTASDKANFYNTKSIQKVTLSNMVGSNVFQANGQGWVKWLIPTATGVASDNAQNAGAANF